MWSGGSSLHSTWLKRSVRHCCFGIGSDRGRKRGEKRERGEKRRESLRMCWFQEGVRKFRPSTFALLFCLQSSLFSPLSPCVYVCSLSLLSLLLSPMQDQEEEPSELSGKFGRSWHSIDQMRLKHLGSPMQWESRPAGYRRFWDVFDLDPHYVLRKFIFCCPFATETPGFVGSRGRFSPILFPK